MKAKKVVASMLMVGLMALSVGCSTKTESTPEDGGTKPPVEESKPDKGIVVSELQAKLTESGLLEQGSMEADAKEHWVFEGVKDSIEEGFVSQAMINVKLQDVFVVKTTDTEGVVKAIEKYKEESLRMFGDGYGGEENITAVADSILEVKDDVVYFIATVNSEDVEKVILGE